MPEESKELGTPQVTNQQSSPAPAPKAAPQGPQPWSGDLPDRLKRIYGSGVQSLEYVGQKYLTVDRTIAREVLRILHDDCGFNYLVDLTAVHNPKKALPFEMVWILYSFASNERIRVHAELADQEPTQTVTDLWSTANWLERECFDMFGIVFTGHPDLRRILLPDGWTGHPLRKDYDVRQQDAAWVQANIGIESGQ